MKLETLLTMNINEASAAFCKLSADEVEELQNASLQLPSVMRCSFARLLVCRNDSLRILSLMDPGDVILCRCCSRYLKIKSVRKDLISKLTSVEEFCKLYNSYSDYGRNSLLEVLVWNKNRDENCLADRLFLDGCLQLNPYQEKLLMNAVSVNVFMDKELMKKCQMKKYFQINRKLFHNIALLKLYELSQKKEENEDEFFTKCNSLLQFILNVWSSFEVDGKTLRVCDLLLDLWLHKKDDKTLINFYIRCLGCQVTNVQLNKEDLYGSRLKVDFRFKSLENFAEYCVKTAPIYFYKRFDIKKLNKAVESHRHFSVNNLLCLYQNACVLDDKTVMDDVLALLSDYSLFPISRSFVTTSELTNIKAVLLPEHFEVFIHSLQDSVLCKMKSMASTSSIISTSLPSLISFLVAELPAECPKNKEILERLFTFEKEFIENGDLSLLYNFYGLQNQEVPLDFLYQLAPKTLCDEFKTCRKWESILCLKGNAYLNTREASQRMAILKALIQIAGRSHDVRALYRCFCLYIRTEMKFNDISLELDSLRDAFGPDSLGLTPLSQKASGSAEEVQSAQQGLLNMLKEWVLSKKGNCFVKPVTTMLAFFYYYATIYPQYEDNYLSFMKSLYDHVLAMDDLHYCRSDMASPHFSNDRKNFYTIPFCYKQRAEKYASFKEVAYYKNFELYMASALEKVPYGKYVSSHQLILFKCSCPFEGLTIHPIAKKPLHLLKDYLDDDKVSYIFDLLVQSVIITNSFDKTNEEVIERYEDCKKQLVRTTTSSLFSGDNEVVKEIIDDKSIEWTCRFNGISAFRTLNKISSLYSIDFATIPQSKRTILQVVDIPETPKSKARKTTLDEKLSNQLSVYRYIIKNQPQLANDYIGSNLFYHNKFSIVRNVNLSTDFFSVECLKRLLSMEISINGIFAVNSVTPKMRDIPVILRALTNSRLEIIHEVVTKITWTYFQAALVTVSLNKSDQPVMDSSVIRQLPDLSANLINACEVLIYVNKEVEMRQMNINTIFDVHTLCPWLMNWLIAVKDGKAQSFYDMKNEEPVTFENAVCLTVPLCFSDNNVVCRLVEILIYSRYVKEYFGKSVTGFAQIATMVSSKTALIMCRRFVLVSSFVHLAESVIQKLLLTASSTSSIITEIMSMIAASSSCITVALIGLLFRLASKPIMRTQDELMKKTIIKVTNYIIENDFKSEDVYVYILTWISKQLLQVDNADIVFINELLNKIVKLKLNEAAGKAVFGLYCSFACVHATKPRPDYLRRLVNCTDVVGEIQDLYEEASAEKQSLFNSTFLKFVPLFDTTSNNELFIAQCSVLLDTQYSGDYARLIEYCHSILEKIYDPCNDASMFYHATSILLLNEYPEIDTLINNAYSLYCKIQELKKKEKKISTLHEYAALGIPKEYDNVMDEYDFEEDILTKCMYTEWFSLRILACLKSTNVIKQTMFTWASCLLKAMPEQFFMNLKGIDAQALCDEMENSIKPWMYVLMSSMTCNLFQFYDDDINKVASVFSEKKTKSSAFILMRCYWVKGATKSLKRVAPTVLEWIQSEGVHDLFCFLSR